MKKEEISAISVKSTEKIKDVIKAVNLGGIGIALVLDKNKKLIGVVSDGDFRRALVKGIDFDSPVSSIMNRDPISMKSGMTEKEVENFVRRDKKINNRFPHPTLLKVPVVDSKGRVKDLIFINKRGKKVTRKKRIEKGDVLNKVLVIGGAGYIGSVLSRKLMEKGYNVTVLDNLLYGDSGIKELYKKPNFNFINGDILRINDIVETLQNIDAVVHLAAVVGDPSSKLKPKETMQINFFATKNMAEICKYLQIPRFIFASTCSVYGFSEDVCHEGSGTHPLSVYAKTKLIAEEGVLSLTDENFSPTVLRFATVYGWSPRMRFDLVANLLVAKAVFEKKITVYGKGKQYRPFISVNDVAEAIIKVLESPLEKVGGQIFNVGSNENNYTIKELAMVIKKHTPGSEIVFLKDKEDDRSYNVSFDKIKNVLGFKAKDSLRNQISEIKENIENGKVNDYRNKKYSNFKSLEGMETML
jgi:nucleoside-diphosphate-sugar epimerase